MMNKQTLVLTACLALSVACSTSQITRTDQTRPTAPASPTVATASDGDVIPSGTKFAVRANERIETAEAGGAYRAEVAQTITDRSGRTIVPAGSPAELTVISGDTGGAVGTRRIELALRSVTVNGRRYDIATLGREESGPAGLGTNRRTAEMVGGAAALGALIGAIAGGGDGAAVGAAVGAAGGAATQVLTRGDKVRIPAETVMTFEVAQPLQLTR